MQALGNSTEPVSAYNVNSFLNAEEEGLTYEKKGTKITKKS
jgi:hypothetical protein